MSLSIQQVQTLVEEYDAFNTAYFVASTALQNVISTGTILYNDANLVTQFPNTSAAYKAYLVSLQSAINTFIASLPSVPPLTG